MTSAPREFASTKGLDLSMRQHRFVSELGAEEAIEGLVIKPVLK
jgi:hypothetical protein